MAYDARLRYPERKRCAGCRGYFGFIVIDGLWCSYRCARIPEISSDPADWPREHYTPVPHSDRRNPKKDFFYPAMAAAVAKRYGKQAYQCGYCLGYHIGSPRPGRQYPGPRIKPI